MIYDIIQFLQNYVFQTYVMRVIYKGNISVYLFKSKNINNGVFVKLNS